MAIGDHLQQGAIVLPEPTAGDARHPGRSAWLCGRLSRVIAGQAAAAVTAGRCSAAVVVLPTWRWVAHPLTARVVPVRLHWEPSPVVVVTSGATATFHWTELGAGHTGSGVTAITASRGAPPPAENRSGVDIPESVTVPTLPPSGVKRALAALAADGETARWEAMIGLEPNVRTALRRAHAEIAAEVGPALDGTCRLVDHIDHQALADWMLLGDASSQHLPPLARLIARCCQPTTFVKVDPKRYVDSALRVYATEAIRRALGDPHVGPKVRAAAAQLGTTNVDDVLAFYRRRRPGDRLGRCRAEAALSILRRPTGPPVPFAAPEAS
jgi:hypothetical protein